MANKARRTRYHTTRALCEGALLVAAAEMLGYLKLGHLPNGGSISLMMLPIIVYSLRWGVGKGLMAGLALGILDFMLGGGVMIGWQSIFGDYLAACTLIGLAGLGCGKGFPGVLFGAVLGCLGRFLAVWVTGATLWGEWMPDAFLGMTMTNEWFYSMLYNGITVGASGIVTIVLCAMMYRIGSLRRFLLGGDIR